MKRVVVVDDEPDVCDMLSTVLKANRYDVSTFTDSNAALAEVLRDPASVSLLILDVLMPDMTGLQLSARLSASGVLIPTLFVSGFSRLQLPEDIEYICKPFTLSSILRKITIMIG